jgi:hypothetical protein
VVHGAGDRLFSGATGSLLLPLPNGVQMLAPAASLQLNATWVHIGTQFGAVVLYWPGGVVAGPLETGVEQVALTISGGLVVRGPASRYLNLGVNATLPLPPAAICILLSGAGA